MQESAFLGCVALHLLLSRIYAFTRSILPYYHAPTPPGRLMTTLKISVSVKYKRKREKLENLNTKTPTLSNLNSLWKFTRSNLKIDYELDSIWTRMFTYYPEEYTFKFELYFIFNILIFHIPNTIVIFCNTYIIYISYILYQYIHLS